MEIPKKKRIRNRKLLDEVASQACVVCKANSDPCHITSRGAGGDDVPSNLVSLCRRHHTLHHVVGWPRFVDRFPQVRADLEAKGWVVEEQQGRKRLVRK